MERIDFPTVCKVAFRAIALFAIVCAIAVIIINITNSNIITDSADASPIMDPLGSKDDGWYYYADRSSGNVYMTRAENDLLNLQIAYNSDGTVMTVEDF